MELIDKATVIAEIERRIANIKDYCLRKEHDTRFDVVPEQLSYILAFIDTLEVKEMDLEADRETAREKSILDENRVEYFATGKPTIAAYSEDNLRNQFDAGADWMKEKIIKILKEK